MKKRILIYYPSNKRSTLFEVQCEQLIKRGCEVLLLTTCEAGVLHEELAKVGVEVFAHPLPKKNAALYYLSQLRYLIHFCREHRIDFVFSNLQHVNFIAVLAQYFMQARVIAFRHHFRFTVYSKEAIPEKNRNEAFFDAVINRLARKIIVLSRGVYDGMKRFERVDLRKVEIVPLMYDFSRYGQPDPPKVREIREALGCRLVLIMVARLIPYKRHEVVFPVIKKLVAEGLDIKLLVLDEGQEKEKLEKYVADHGLSDHIRMLGFRRDFLDYMAAADLLIHPSLTESSNSVTKEMGLLEKAVAVCEGVGDFSDYIVEGTNGFFLPIDRPEAAIEAAIRKVYENPQLVMQLGRRLREDVLTRFSVREETVDLYMRLLQ